jgi:hypothetical protein
MYTNMYGGDIRCKGDVGNELRCETFREKNGEMTKTGYSVIAYDKKKIDEVCTFLFSTNCENILEKYGLNKKMILSSKDTFDKFANCCICLDGLENKYTKTNDCDPKIDFPGKKITEEFARGSAIEAFIKILDMIKDENEKRDTDNKIKYMVFYAAVNNPYDKNDRLIHYYQNVFGFDLTYGVYNLSYPNVETEEYANTEARVSFDIVFDDYHKNENRLLNLQIKLFNKNQKEYDEFVNKNKSMLQCEINRLINNTNLSLGRSPLQPIFFGKIDGLKERLEKYKK